jgi:hypothetical protein
VQLPQKVFGDEVIGEFDTLKEIPALPSSDGTIRLCVIKYFVVTLEGK